METVPVDRTTIEPDTEGSPTPKEGSVTVSVET